MASAHSRSNPASNQRTAAAIRFIRGHRTILDVDPATLYDVTTKRLNEQVKRTAGRFPPDFMFRRTPDETTALNRSQIATGSQKRRNIAKPPVAFTEHGAIMAATILNNARAKEMSIYVVREFVRLRELLASNKEPGLA